MLLYAAVACFIALFPHTHLTSTSFVTLVKQQQRNVRKQGMTTKETIISMQLCGLLLLSSEICECIMHYLLSYWQP